jgi:leucine dehydrogenase
MARFRDHGTGDHEDVVFVNEPDVGLRAIIAVHSTALGPSLGGIRFWSYEREDHALADVLRLAEAMTLKAACAGLHQGGGKAVVITDDPIRTRTDAQLRALGRAVHALGGRYIAAEDVGATVADMDGLARETPWVTGVAETAGGSGDPSPATAYGVRAGMRAALRALDGDPTLAGRRVVVQGAGKAGSHLVRLLVDDGARVAVADIRPERVTALIDDLGVEPIAPEQVVDEPCDVFAPCALGGVLNERTVPRLRCRVIAGAANNQLADVAVGDTLHERGIVYAPDYVVNAGGIINIAEEFTGYDRARALRRTAEIETTTARVLTAATEWRVSPARAAERIARERIAREGRGRWQPGDPAHWTDGAPLTRLRP